MPSTTKLPSRLAKVSNRTRPAEKMTIKSARLTYSRKDLSFALSIVLVVVCLLMTTYTENALQGEFFKALTVVACLNLFRVLTNSDIPTKQ